MFRAVFQVARTLAGREEVVAGTVSGCTLSARMRSPTALAQRLASDGEPALVTAAIVSALGVPGALVEVSAVAAVLRD